MVLIYPNTPAKQKDYEEQIVHTFYLTNAVPKDVESMLKSMLGAKTLFVDERTNVVVMRDTPDAVRMAEKLVASIDVPEPEVLIEVEVLEIARSKLLNLGITSPGSITATFSPLTGGERGLWSVVGPQESEFRHDRRLAGERRRQRSANRPAIPTPWRVRAFAHATRKRPRF